MFYAVKIVENPSTTSNQEYCERIRIWSEHIRSELQQEMQDVGLDDADATRIVNQVCTSECV